jgi:hypothetical protein
MRNSQAVGAETETLVCDYSRYATPDGLEKVKEPFVLTFILDLENHTAYLLGNLGSAKVQALSGDKGLTFIEITAAGNVMTTTLDHAGDSVHSRHTLIMGDLVPSQYYGKCVFR